VDLTETTDGSREGVFTRHAAVNGTYQSIRALATDGHNRIFFNGAQGSTWGIKAVRLEDVRRAPSGSGSDKTCVTPPDWDGDGTPDYGDWEACFNVTEGSVKTAYWPGTLTGVSLSEWSALGSMPSAIPVDLEVLVHDEKGKPLELKDFYNAYHGDDDPAGSGDPGDPPGDPENPERTPFDELEPDEEGIYDIGITLYSSYNRASGGQLEASLKKEAAANPANPPQPIRLDQVERSDSMCEDEEPYDRYQRVTIDNLTTGQSWSFDVENPWPTGGGSGVRQVFLRARRGDQLQIRYNITAIGHIAMLGSGITVVDLNRFYKLVSDPDSLVGVSQCGRRLGAFEGGRIDFHEENSGQGSGGACEVPESIDSIAMTPAVAVKGGTATTHTFSPLLSAGVVRTTAPANQPGQFVAEPIFRAIRCIAEDILRQRDVALASDVTWVDRGIRGTFDGRFRAQAATPPEPPETTGDLVFVSLGNGGIYVFDLSKTQNLSESTLIGRLHVERRNRDNGEVEMLHSIYRLQVDPSRGLLFAGGFNKKGVSIIDVWDMAAVNGAPDLPCSEGGECAQSGFAPQPLMTLYNVDWNTNHIGIDQFGTGLLHTWDLDDGPSAVPFAAPQLLFSGLYLPEEESSGGGSADKGDDEPGADVRPIAIQRITTHLEPLGIPLEASVGQERENEEDNRRKATAAFKIRAALPGSVGDALTVKVQSLRSLPEPRFLGRKDVGRAVALPGGPGWPESEVIVTLRRIGLGDQDQMPDLPEGDPLHSEGGKYSGAYNLYESEETILLLADPRAQRDYELQGEGEDDSTDEEDLASEKLQCRRCEYP
ncbi:MAG: hypothetical protein GY835_09290, partial [bacterium]|nr:hypothetical protein [bacterium]